ncbi:MAG: sigma-70 family RNA polymerase sigma factor [Kineosporiaceae bacterium]
MLRPDEPGGGPSDLDRLLRAAARGDDRAWAELVRRHAELVRAVCRRCGVFGACADDVAQVTWLALFTNIEKIHTPHGITAWLRTTARRECLSQRRRAAREVPRHDLDCPVIGPDPDEWLEAHRVRLMIRQAVGLLRGRERALVELLLQPDPPSYVEISRRLDMPLGAVGPVRQRALRRLREALGSELMPGLGPGASADGLAAGCRATA